MAPWLSLFTRSDEGGAVLLLGPPILKQKDRGKTAAPLAAVGSFQLILGGGFCC